MSVVEDAVRAWAKGIYPTEAGVELLIRQGKAIYEGAPWLEDLEPPGTDRPRMVAIDVETLLARSGLWSGGEQRVVRLAASLIGGPPVALADDIVALDRENLAALLAAVAHAAGSHEESGITFDPATGAPIGFYRLATLYPWPVAERPR